MNLPDLSGILTREYAIRADANPRTDGTHGVDSIGVPYDQETQILPGLYESMAPGAVQPRDHRPLMWRHSEPIGVVTDDSQEADGWHYSATISDTTTGRDAYTLLKDGAVRSSSIGFVSLAHEITEDQDGNLHVRHTSVDVHEVSLVPVPAYDGAAVTQIRSAIRHDQPPEAPMPDTIDLTETRERLDSIETRATDMERTLTLLRSSSAADADKTDATSAALAELGSMGAYVRALAVDTDDRHDLAMRAFTGAILGDGINHPQWVGDVIRLITDRYRLTNLFRHTTDLPGVGNMVEYGLLKSDTTQVAEQVAEGDDLAFGKVSLQAATAPVKTYGGWSALSRQAIERSSENLLDLTWRALAMKYGKAIEAATRTVFNTAFTAAAASVNDKVMLGGATPVTLAGSTSDSWLATVLDLLDLFDARNYNLDGIIVSKDVFLKLAAIPEQKKMLQITGAPDDKAGTLTVSVPSADLYGLPVTSVPFLAASTVAAYDRQAIRIQESAGAPFRLQDANIVNLTGRFSLYGYASHYLQLAGGIVAVDTDGVK